MRHVVAHPVSRLQRGCALLGIQLSVARKDKYFRPWEASHNVRPFQLPLHAMPTWSQPRLACLPCHHTWSSGVWSSRARAASGSIGCSTHLRQSKSTACNCCPAIPLVQLSLFSPSAIPLTQPALLPCHPLAQLSSCLAILLVQLSLLPSYPPCPAIPLAQSVLLIYPTCSTIPLPLVQLSLFPITQLSLYVLPS